MLLPFLVPWSIWSRGNTSWMDQGCHTDSGGLLTAHKSTQPPSSQLPAGHTTSCASSPMAVTNAGPALGACWMLHTSQQISLREKRSWFHIRSCGFTCAGRRRRSLPTRLWCCCSPCRPVPFCYCGEERRPFGGPLYARFTNSHLIKS